MKHEQYESYKNSEIDRIENMPSDWKKKRLKDLATYNDNSLNNNVSGNTIINYIDIGSVTTASINCYEELLYRNAPSRAKRIIRTGDILVSTVRTYLKAISFVSKEYNGFVASTGFAVIRPKILFDNKFAAYSLISNVFINEVQANSVGVSYPAINASKLITFPVILPSLNTQKKIASYLDIKTLLINKEQSILEEKIKKYKELKQTLITQTVSRGLNKNKELKHSEIEEIGYIPIHWR